MADYVGKWEKINGVLIELQSRKAQLGDDPEWVPTKEGTSRVRLKLAIDRYRRGENGIWERDQENPTDWYTANVYGSQAENILNSLSKGDPVIASGTGEVLVRPVQQENGEIEVQSVKILTYGVQISPDLARTSAELTPSLRQQLQSEQNVKEGVIESNDYSLKADSQKLVAIQGSADFRQARI